MMRSTTTGALCLLLLACVVDGFNLPAMFGGLSVSHRAVNPVVRPGLLGATLSSSVCDRPSLAQRLRVAAPRKATGRRPNGYWKVFENVELEILQIVDVLGLDGTMPTEAQLRKNSLSSLSDALVKEHGGFAAVAERLGLHCASKPKGYWTEFDNVVRELEAYMQANDLGDTLPSQADLRKAGRTDLISGMQVHGGMSAFAEHFGYSMAEHKVRATGYSLKKRLDEEVKSFVGQHGTPGVMPTLQLLMSWGRDDLARGVQRHGGVAECARKFGLAIRRADPELEQVAVDLRELAARLGAPSTLPTVRELSRAGRPDLAAQVDKRGYRECANILGMRAVEPAPAPAPARPTVASESRLTGGVLRTRASVPAPTPAWGGGDASSGAARFGRRVAVGAQGSAGGAGARSLGKSKTKEVAEFRERMRSRLAGRAAAPKTSVYDALM